MVDGRARARSYAVASSLWKSRSGVKVPDDASAQVSGIWSEEV